jgi:dolichyl-phosphate beta-glucosyltransferase
LSVAPELSVVIPAYNEAERLPETIEKIKRYLAEKASPFELIVVDDGSTDATAERAALAIGTLGSVIRLGRNRGKGHAVRRGMLAATGARRLMTDADLSTPIEDLPKLMARLDAGDEVAIASRALEDSRIEIRQPSFRENVGRLFNAVVQVLVVSGIRDTQCGFKLFTADAAELIFGATRLDGFAFDVEALYLAKRAGLAVSEVGVTWRNDEATRVTTLRGVIAFLDVARIVLNSWLGRYRVVNASTR